MEGGRDLLAGKAASTCSNQQRDWLRILVVLSDQAARIVLSELEDLESETSDVLVGPLHTFPTVK